MDDTRPHSGLDPETESLVEDVRRAIVERAPVKPHLIVLFGSEARGEATLESDIDVLVVLEHGDAEATRAIRDAAYDVMWEHDFRRLISVVTITRREFEEQIRKGFSFVRNVEREGLVLWRAA